MSVTPAEVLLLLQGEGSPELQERFRREATDPQSELAGMLRGVETWARASLNANSPSSASADEAAQPIPATPTFHVFRKAALLDEFHTRATPADLVAYIRGEASPETSALVKKALEDRSSELSQMLKRLEQQGK